MTDGPTIGHNACPDDWRDDATCEDLMTKLLAFKDDPFRMEAMHLSYLQFFGESYRGSDFAGMVRRLIHEATGREVK